MLQYGYKKRENEPKKESLLEKEIIDVDSGGTVFTANRAG